MARAGVNGAGELDLTELQEADVKSRDEWSRACAVVLIQKLGRYGCQLVSARGFNEFLTYARREYANHEFKYEDFQRIFKFIRIASRHPITPAMILTRDRKKGRIH